MIITTKIIAFLICTAIAYSIALIGKNKKIGFKWAFYFGLLMPLLGLSLAIFSKKNDGITKKKPKTIFILAIICNILGIIYIAGASSTYTVMSKMNSSTNNIQEEISSRSNIDTGNIDDDIFLTVLSNRIGCYIGGGILSYTIQMSSIRSNDYKYRSLIKVTLGITLFSIGIFLMRNNRRMQVLHETQIL